MENMNRPLSPLVVKVWIRLLTEFASWVDDEEIAEGLIAHGFSPNVAMYVAIRTGDEDLLEAALGEPADLHFSINGQSLVFDFLLRYPEKHHRVIGKVLDRMKAGEREEFCRSLLHSMFWINDPHLRTAKVILEKSNVVNSVDNNGRTALMKAAIHNSTHEAVRLLLKAGADPDIRDADGHTVLYNAALTGSNFLVKTLLEAGASPWIADPDGLLPIDVAVFKNTKRTLARAMEKTKKPRPGLLLN